MKKLSIILACALVALVSCTKSIEVHPEIGDGNDEILTIGMDNVNIKYTRNDIGNLQKVVFHYSITEEQQFDAAEMTKKSDYFEVTVNNLVNDTLYSYYYELFPYNGNASLTTQKTFHTQANETPAPPTPPTPPSDVPEGAINGLFTINDNGDKIYFSQGNLQYQASTNTWRFAENQWDVIGEANINVSPTYDGWIDLFGWGTSGYNHGAVCYQPWSTSQSEEDYFVYGSPSMNLYDQTGQADWGYNVISNGGNDNKWRTLTSDELEFLFYRPNIAPGMHYAKAMVNGVNGLILLPDNWDSSILNLNDTDKIDAYFNSNVIGLTDWTTVLQSNGAVFIPITGCRFDSSIYDVDRAGCYWTSSYNNDSFFYGANTFDFGGSSLYNSLHFTAGARYRGASVRLVQDANP